MTSISKMGVNLSKIEEVSQRCDAWKCGECDWINDVPSGRIAFGTLHPCTNFKCKTIWLCVHEGDFCKKGKNDFPQVQRRMRWLKTDIGESKAKAVETKAKKR